MTAKDATIMQFEEKCAYILNYEKDYTENKDEDIPPKLKQIIKDIVKREGYTEYNINIKAIPADGGNYLARLFEVHVSGTTKDGRKEADIFVKNIVPDELFSMFSVAEAYRKEVYAYTELLQIYNNLQIDAKVPIQERLKVVKSYEESDKEFIILDNIAKKGFTTLDRLKTISFEFAKISVEQLAKFHALSFVLEKKQPEYFNRKVKCHKPCFTFNEDWNKFIENFSKISMEYLDDKMKKKVKEIIPMALEKLPDYHLNTKTVCCLCHGDFRANNIMLKMNMPTPSKLPANVKSKYLFTIFLKYINILLSFGENHDSSSFHDVNTYNIINAKDEKIEEVMVIDYQIIHYGSPINDLLYFIFGATDQQFRKEHLEDIKDVYHNTLGNFLRYFNIDVNEVFSRKTFEKLYKERLDYGLLTAVWFLPIVLADTDDIPDFSQQSACDMTFKTDKSMKERLEGIIDDFTQWGYL